jgi:hypothetical protein
MTLSNIFKFNQTKMYMYMHACLESKTLIFICTLQIDLGKQLKQRGFVYIEGEEPHMLIHGDWPPQRSRSKRDPSTFKVKKKKPGYAHPMVIEHNGKAKRILYNRDENTQMCPPHGDRFPRKDKAKRIHLHTR